MSPQYTEVVLQRFYSILGALFPWRLAVGLVCVPAFLCFAILLTIAPESPAWLMSKAKDKGQLISKQYFFPLARSFESLNFCFPAQTA